MKYNILCVFFFLLVISCKSPFVDSKIGNMGTGDKGIILTSNTNYNELNYNPTVQLSKDKEILLLNNYNIYLPKGIVSYSIRNNILYFYYSNNEIIIINSGEKEKERIEDGSLNDFYIDNEDFYKNAGSQPYIYISREYLRKPQKGRITKIFSNNNIFIILYNIKKNQ
ncbi:hypothetical protein [Dysgonomonas termitidis]|uniref:Lipoprotein n=1 Tax=Dysgonomonas termitidis TaxID=1516126 RepID=A0ABV9KYW1_9BACT